MGKKTDGQIDFLLDNAERQGCASSATTTPAAKT